VVSISLANSSNLLFHAVSRPGIQPDNDIWVARKRKTVLRWGVSTWFMHNKFKGDEEAFSKKYMLGGEAAGTYAIHGGGVPVRVTGVEGIVGVVVVSGLKQDQDHMVVIEALGEFLEQCGKEASGGAPGKGVLPPPGRGPGQGVGRVHPGGGGGGRRGRPASRRS